MKTKTAGRSAIYRLPAVLTVRLIHIRWKSGFYLGYT